MPFVQCLVLLAALTAGAESDTTTQTAPNAETAPMPSEQSRLILKHGWLVKNASLVPEEGEVVSSAGFASEGWHPTSVPATALTALVRNGVYPDPRTGMNAFRIPDAADAFNAEHDLATYSHLPDGRNPWRDPYWYRTIFDLPEARAGKCVWLDLDAMNYRADIWLNGVKVADRAEVVGSFSRYRFDITRHAQPGATNCLAVKVYPVDHPGVPDAQLEVFGAVRNFRKEIMKDVTLVMSIGYDCMPTVPDRLTGLWQDVHVGMTGPVAIEHPFVTTQLPLPDTSPAALTVSAELVNATASVQEGTLRGTIIEAGVEVRKAIELNPGERQEVVFSPEDPGDLVIDDPRLWWPRNYGEQPLYTLKLSVEVDGRVSDNQDVRFGIRQVTKELHKLDGAHGLRLHVNGKKIFCTGGYIQPEVMHDWDAARIETEVRYLSEANLNLVYFEDVPNPPDAFLEACDRYGLMFGNCFYGCYWMQPGTEYPQDLALLERGTADIIKRYRNHPSLVLYMAMNEGETREDVYTMWRDHVVKLDGTRLFIPSGSFPDYRENAPPWIKPDTPVGMNDYSPKSYGWQAPSTYFRWVREERNWMFMMESGSASLPPIDSLRRFVPNLGETVEGAPFPLNKTWAHHGANSYYKPYDDAIRRLHGEPESVADYCMKGHLVTADQHRAMFEAANHRMWAITSGFTEWKVNACWPSVQWQVYDWFLKPMVSYYYIRNACEPLHVQMDPIDSMVTVVNHHLAPQRDLVVKAGVYAMDMGRQWEKQEAVSIEANTYRDIFAIPPIAGLTGVYFVKLELNDSTGAPISRNFYWLLAEGAADFTALQNLPPVALNVAHEVESRHAENVIHVTVENPTEDLAFFVHVAVTRGPYGEEVLPVFWEDNYFSLVPGESRRVSARISLEDLDGATPSVEVGGWNIVSGFACTALEVSKSAVKPNDPFTVTATIEGTFIDGSRIAVRVDGTEVASRLVYARPGAPRQFEFALTLGEPGRHEISVGEQAVSVRVE